MLTRRLQQLLADTRGADLVEYALLAAFFGLAVVTGFDAIEATILSVYQGWDAGIQSLYSPLDPGAYGS